MPKIVDHAAHRTDLALRASKYFSKHGYAGGSMRNIAEYLGVSKSALYHYFPNKESLFLACTEQVMSQVDVSELEESATQQEQIQQLINVMQVDFGSEMALLFDYLRNKSKAEIAENEAMQVSIETYRRMVEAIVGANKTDETLAMIMGTLLLDHLSGGTWAASSNLPSK